MRGWSATLLLIPLMLLGCQKEQANKPGGPVQGPAEIEAYFSPRGGVTEAVVKELGKARGTVRVQAYSFTSAPIAKALVDARKRGVDVRVILDRSQRTEKYSSADFLVHSDIPTLIDDKHQIAHNKIMIIDGQTVLTGSFNFTKSAEENNAENLLILRNKDLAAKYTQNWDAHAAHSQPYKGRETRVSAGGGLRDVTTAKTPIVPRIRDGAQGERGVAVPATAKRDGVNQLIG